MQVPSVHEIKQLLHGIPQKSTFGARDSAMFRLLLVTGLRVAELAGLDVQHVAEAGVPRSLLVVPSSIAKGSRARAIELNSRGRQAVAEILAFNQLRGFSVAPEAPLLVTRKHTRLPVRTIQHLMKVYREKAQLELPVTPHALRHAFATELARKATNLKVVKLQLGHRRLETCEIYVQPTREECQAAMKKVGSDWEQAE